jgi:hypothetical protein
MTYGNADYALAGCVAVVTELIAGHAPKQS